MTLGDWLTMAYAIDRRRSSAVKYAAEARHMRAFPVDEIGVELDVQLLQKIAALLKGPPHHYRTGFERPLRGHRGDAPQTPIIMALANRETHLRATGVGGNSGPQGTP